MKYEDIIQKNCEKEAIDFVQSILNKTASCTVVWFAFLPCGYKCMIVQNNTNHFFEVMRKADGEMCCNVFDRVRYVVKPSQK